MIKAIGLISGGLDSILAAKIIQEQGIAVIGLNFRTPFCKNKIKDKIANLGIELKEVPLMDEFLEVIKKPRYGFGSNMNPCIDCKILMLMKAAELMREWDAKFVITGEVLGQRPMSQNRQALSLIEKRAGLEGLLLRPLCARLFPETIPEREGWVKRDQLLGFSGRGRKPQIALAEKLKIKDYHQPAGGCLLTDPEFSRRLKDLIAHQELNIDNVELLKLGRHFRIAVDTKLIIGRDEKENEKLVALAKESDYLFYPDDTLAGPTALGRGIFNEGLIKLCARLVARYCDLDGRKEANIIYKKIGAVSSQETALSISPLEDNNLSNFRI